jgi:transaldolase
LFSSARAAISPISGATFTRLPAALQGAARPLHYLAIPPGMFVPVVQGLSRAGCTPQTLFDEGERCEPNRFRFRRSFAPERGAGFFHLMLTNAGVLTRCRTTTLWTTVSGNTSSAGPHERGPPCATGGNMNATSRLRDVDQSLWLDNITRGLLTGGALRRYIDEFAVTGLTSNPTIFDHAIRNADFYDGAIRRKSLQGKSGEALFFELALEDLIEAADLFRPVHDATAAVDGWVSIEVSPLLADDTAGTVDAAVKLHARAKRPNLFVKIPGTRAGIPAIEEAIFAGVPVNVTLLFSREQYVAAAEAYWRGIERRIAAGLDPKVDSVASLFVSRWDVAVKDTVPPALRNRLGIAVAMRTYKAYRDLLGSPRWRTLAAAGARPQRLLWASTGTKDPQASDVLYLEALAAPDTINTIPEKTLRAFADHGEVKGVMPVNGGDAEIVLAEFARAGVNDAALADMLQREGVAAFAASWQDLMDCIATKSATLSKVMAQ